MDFLNQILNSTSTLVIFALDKEYRYTFFNANHASTMKTIWGEEIKQGASMLNFITNEGDRKKASINFDRALNGEEFSEIEEYGNENYSRRHYENFYAPLKNDDQQIIGLTVFVTDISEQMKDQQLLESINQNIAEGIYRSDANGLVYVNNAFVKMFGYESQAEVLSLQSPVLYKDPKQRNQLIEILNSDGFYVNEEVTFVKKTGKKFSTLVSTITYTDPSGHVFMDGAIRDITLELEANRKVHENEQLLESINRNISEGIYRSDETKGLTYVNQAFVRMFGYESAEEIINHDALDLYKNSEERRSRESVDPGGFTNQEVEFKRKDGTYFWGALSSIKIIDEEGHAYFDGAIRDISEQKNAEQQLEVSLKLLESINENISEGIYRSNEKGLIYINKAFVSLFGYGSEEEVLNIASPVLYKDPSQRDLLREVLETQGFFENEEIVFIRKNGQEFTGLISSTSYKDPAGNTFWDGAIRDISQQKQAEIQIKRQTQMQQMLTGISMQYINIPLEKIEENINKSLKELGVFVGADRAFVFDLDADERVFTTTHEWCADGIDSLIELGQNVPFAIMPHVVELYQKGKPFIIDEDSKFDPVEYKNQMIFQNIKSLVAVPCMLGSSCVGVVGFDYVNESRIIGENEMILLGLFAQMLVNIRIRTHYQKERQELLQTTTDQNNRLKDFSYITSHNIRSSVANFIGLLDIQKQDPTNGHVGEMLQTTARKLNDTINNINELLNFENEIGSLSKVKCNLNEIVQHVIDLNKQDLSKNDIEVILESDGDFIVHGIRAYLDSIFHNFMTNAIKYGTSPRSNKIEISISRDDGGYLVKFQDHGQGIDMDKYGDKLFSLGTRFHSAHGDGQGLGLFMVKRHIDAMGGRIHVESELNKGTIFSVWFHE